VRALALARTGSAATAAAWRALRIGRSFRCSSTSSSEGTLPQYLLKLYVTGSSARAERAVANLRRICEQELSDQYQLMVIDVLQQPQLAEDEKILATPTLIKELPPPLRRVIGDLSDKDKVLLGLELRVTDSSRADPPSSSEPR
jgi:circadian clock protein KaiB